MAIKTRVSRFMHISLARCRRFSEKDGLCITRPSKEALDKKLRECLRNGCICSTCGRTMIFPGVAQSLGNLSFDHITPLASGGTNDIDNIAICHTHCNSIKSPDNRVCVYESDDNGEQTQ